jgi:hypothetical protein
MVAGNVFGVTATDEGVRLQPFVTTKLRREVFAGTDQATLHQLPLRAARVSVRLLLPPVSPLQGVHKVDKVLLNGVPVDATIPWARLRDGDVIEIALGAVVASDRTMTRVNADPYVESSAVFGPRDPVIAAIERDTGGHARLRFGGKDKGIVYHVYRDGTQVAANVAAGAWVDREVHPQACYAIEAAYPVSGNRSHHSAPRCVGAVTEMAARDSLDLPSLRIDATGDYAVQLRYRNEANQINLGISGGVKWLSIEDAAGRTVAQGVVQLPHTRPAIGPALSTPLSARLQPGAYRVRLDDFYNMSYLESNASFSGAGGTGGPSNRFDLFGVRVQRVR